MPPKSIVRVADRPLRGRQRAGKLVLRRREDAANVSDFFELKKRLNLFRTFARLDDDVLDDLATRESLLGVLGDLLDGGSQRRALR